MLYYDANYSFDDDYAPAYRFGYDARTRYQNQERTDIDDNLRSEWQKNRGQSKLDWDKASGAVDDSWDRYDEAVRARNENSGGTATPGTYPNAPKP